MHISSVLVGLAALGAPLTVASAISHDAAYQSPVINTTNGDVRGAPSPFRGGNMATVYKGIPFAAPPTGSNRWKAPKSRIRGMACSMPLSSALNARRVSAMPAFSPAARIPRARTAYT